MSKKDGLPQEYIQGLGIIQGWREIGRYIGRSARTARRWYDQKYLIVHHSFTGRPFIFVFELDTFMLEIDKARKKHMAGELERLHRHAAMMRSRKGRKDGSGQKNG